MGRILSMLCLLLVVFNPYACTANLESDETAQTTAEAQTTGEEQTNEDIHTPEVQIPYPEDYILSDILMHKIAKSCVMGLDCEFEAGEEVRFKKIFSFFCWEGCFTMDEHALSDLVLPYYDPQTDECSIPHEIVDDYLTKRFHTVPVPESIDCYDSETGRYTFSRHVGEYYYYTKIVWVHGSANEYEFIAELCSAIGDSTMAYLRINVELNENIYTIIGFDRMTPEEYEAWRGSSDNAVDSTVYNEIIQSYRKSAEFFSCARITDYPSNEEYGKDYQKYRTNCPIDVDLGHWGYMWSEANVAVQRSDYSLSFGYALEDLNSDQKDELILLLSDYTVLAIFTEVDETPVFVDAFWPRYKAAILDSGEVFTLSSGGASLWAYDLSDISKEGELVSKLKFGMEDREYYEMIDGEKTFISEEEYVERYSSYPVLSVEEAARITKESGIKFIPLAY